MPIKLILLPKIFLQPTVRNTTYDVSVSHCGILRLYDEIYQVVLIATATSFFHGHGIHRCTSYKNKHALGESHILYVYPLKVLYDLVIIETNAITCDGFDFKLFIFKFSVDGQ